MDIMNKSQTDAAEFAARIIPFINAYSVYCVENDQPFNVEDFASYIISAQDKMLAEL